MKFPARSIALAFFGTFLAAAHAVAQTVTVDYDPTINFAKYKSYTLQKIHATDPGVEQRITIALDRNLTARYLHADDKGEVILAFIEVTKDKQDYSTFYDGLEGLPWQRGWGKEGFMDATATVQDIPVGTLILDMWDRKTQKLIWRGTLTEPLTSSEDKNEQKMDKAIGQLLAKFPPKYKKP